MIPPRCPRFQGTLIKHPVPISLWRWEIDKEVAEGEERFRQRGLDGSVEKGLPTEYPKAHILHANAELCGEKILGVKRIPTNPKIRPTPELPAFDIDTTLLKVYGTDRGHASHFCCIHNESLRAVHAWMMFEIDMLNQKGWFYGWAPQQRVLVHGRAPENSVDSWILPIEELWDLPSLFEYFQYRCGKCTWCKHAPKTS